MATKVQAQKFDRLNKSTFKIRAGHTMAIGTPKGAGMKEVPGLSRTEC